MVNLLQRTCILTFLLFDAVSLTSFLVSPPSDCPSERFSLVIHVHPRLTFFNKSTALSFISPSCPSCSVFHHQPDEPTVTGATTTRAGGSAGSTRGTATERAGTTEENWVRVTTTPTSEPKKQNKTNIPFSFLSFCQLQFACFPVVPSSRPNSPKHHFTTWNSQPKPPLPPHCTALPCPALPLATPPALLSQPVS